MNRNRFSCLKFTLVVAFFALGCSSDLLAQETKTSTKRTVLDALRDMDTPSEKDLEWVTAFLEARIALNEKDSFANCVLAMTQFRMRDFPSALKSIERSNAGANSKDTRATSGKLQLLCLINIENAVEATRLFQALLNACQRESVPMDLRKSYCEWMGEIIGTLDSTESQSPIDLELLSKARKSLIGIPELKLSQAFENQYSLAHARSQVILKTLTQHQELGDVGLQEMERNMSVELENLEQILASSVKETKEVTGENQATAKSLKQEIASLREQIRRRDAERASVGPGMPAPVFPPSGQPVLPNRDAIYVNQFFFRYIIETINQQQFTREIQVPRDLRDIEAERSSIYQNQLNLYNAQLANYKVQVSLFSQYQKNLADWNRREEDRRKKLLDERNAFEDKTAQLKLKLDDIEAANKENAGGNSDLRKSIQKLKAELGTVRLVLDAAKLGKPYLALRPTKIDPWLLTEEKNRLLKAYSDK